MAEIRSEMASAGGLLPSSHFEMLHIDWRQHLSVLPVRNHACRKRWIPVPRAWQEVTRGQKEPIVFIQLLNFLPKNEKNGK